LTGVDCAPFAKQLYPNDIRIICDRRALDLTNAFLKWHLFKPNPWLLKGGERGGGKEACSAPVYHFRASKPYASASNQMRGGKKKGKGKGGRGGKTKPVGDRPLVCSIKHAQRFRKKRKRRKKKKE